MTELQQTFLFYTAIYFVIKGGLYMALYVATLVVEREARLRHKRLKLYLIPLQKPQKYCKTAG